jgi:hypothetical protein
MDKAHPTDPDLRISSNKPLPFLLFKEGDFSSAVRELQQCVTVH